ncbi:MAG: hypothetical protein FIA82_09460 [Melioribacter sp.]|nr:hypothetical protein [Melioribacter sp.]
MRNKFTYINKILFIITFIITIISCKDNSTINESDVSYESVFLYSPMDVDKILWLEPLGWINPVGHTFPTDHVYFIFNFNTPTHQQDPNYKLPIYAPASGKIDWYLMENGRNDDSKVMIKVNSTFSYYLDHIILDSAFVLGSIVTAGKKIGTTARSGSIDLGVINQNITLTGFVNPARYPGSIHCDSPYKYFQEPLKSKLYSLVKRNAPDKDGKIDYDIRGRLIGNWFHESVRIEDSMGPLAWPKEIAFAPDPNEPSIMILSFGGYAGILGKYKPSITDPDPSQVSVSSGKVIYHVNYLEFGYAGLLAVQLIDDIRMKVEFFPNKTGDTAEFDNNALIYTR